MLLPKGRRSCTPLLRHVFAGFLLVFTPIFLMVFITPHVPDSREAVSPDRKAGRPRLGARVLVVEMEGYQATAETRR